MLGAGQVASLDNQIDLTTGTVKLKATFANEDGTLFPNQFVNVRLQAETRQNAIIAPSGRDPAGPWQRCSSTSSRLTRAWRNAPCQNRCDGRVRASRVTSGLQPGDVVVIDGRPAARRCQGRSSPMRQVCSRKSRAARASGGNWRGKRGGGGAVSALQAEGRKADRSGAQGDKSDKSQWQRTNMRISDAAADQSGGQLAAQDGTEFGPKDWSQWKQKQRRMLMA